MFMGRVDGPDMCINRPLQSSSMIVQTRDGLGMGADRSLQCSSSSPALLIVSMSVSFVRCSPDARQL
jgi:hypothetical protein